MLTRFPQMQSSRVHIASNYYPACEQNNTCSQMQGAWRVQHAAKSTRPGSLLDPLSVAHVTPFALALAAPACTPQLQPLNPNPQTLKPQTCL